MAAFMILRDRCANNHRKMIPFVRFLSQFSTARYAAEGCTILPRLLIGSQTPKVHAEIGGRMISTTKNIKEVRELGPILKDHPLEEGVDDDTVVVRWREAGIWKEARNPKDWVSYGYHAYDAETDRWEHRVLMFFMFSMVLTAGMMFKWKPDLSVERDWVVREAHLELARREKYGLPQVDYNYIPEEVMLAQLPSDEEIGDQEVII